MTLSRKERFQLRMLVSIVIEIILLKLLWNSIMVSMFHLATINYWQSFLMCMLFAILFTNSTQTRYQEYISEQLEELITEVKKANLLS
jgi:hypothetical protein